MLQIGRTRPTSVRKVLERRAPGAAYEEVLSKFATSRLRREIPEGPSYDTGATRDSMPIVCNAPTRPKSGQSRPKITRVSMPTYLKATPAKFGRPRPPSAIRPWRCWQRRGATSAVSRPPTGLGVSGGSSIEHVEDGGRQWPARSICGTPARKWPRAGLWKMLCLFGSEFGREANLSSDPIHRIGSWPPEPDHNVLLSVFSRIFPNSLQCCPILCIGHP